MPAAGYSRIPLTSSDAGGCGSVSQCGFIYRIRQVAKPGTHSSLWPFPSCRGIEHGPRWRDRHNACFSKIGQIGKLQMPIRRCRQDCPREIKQARGILCVAGMMSVAVRHDPGQFQFLGRIHTQGIHRVQQLMQPVCGCRIVRFLSRRMDAAPLRWTPCANRVNPFSGNTTGVGWRTRRADRECGHETILQGTSGTFLVCIIAIGPASAFGKLSPSYRFCMIEAPSRYNRAEWKRDVCDCQHVLRQYLIPRTRNLLNYDREQA